MANRIPEIGASGLYTLLSPFNNQIQAGVSYRCIAVRRFTDITNSGEDPKQLYYDPYELDDAWAIDSLNPEICIVTIVSTASQEIKVPSSFIESYPDVGGVAYTARLLGISLGAIPDEMDLANLIQGIQDLVRDTVGINSEAKTVAVSSTKLLTETAHEALEQARADLITVSTTNRARVLELERENTALREQNTALMKYIEDTL